MKESDFKKVKEKINPIEGGIKESCLVAHEYLKNCKITEEGTIINNSAVSEVDFLVAVKTLVAYSWENRENDCLPNFWDCSNDCVLNKTTLFCPGECQVKNKNKSLTNKECSYKL